MERLHVSGNTDPGRRRPENQDACIVQPLWGHDKALLAVIDGVGGYTGGEKAAAIAKESIEQYMEIPRGDTLTMLREAVLFANNRIWEERKKDPQLSEMCCVLTAAVADAASATLYLVHVGDTRLYRYRQGQLQKLTNDHSVVGVKEDAGEISEWEAMMHPQRNQILREVGSAWHRLDDEGFMDFGKEEFLPGDLLLLCSDGLTDMITQKQMLSVLTSGQPLPQLAESLIALANKMGGHDNITVVLAQRENSHSPAQPDVPPEAAIKEASVEPPKQPARKTRTTRKKKGLAIITLLVVATAGWYFAPVKKTSASLSQEHHRLSDSGTISNNRPLPAVRTMHPAVPGPLMKTDTLRISSTQNLEDLLHYADSTGRVLVLVPAGRNKRFAAVEITKRSARPGDTLLIRNLRLKDFETGINVHVPVLLKTENLVFENILYPFNYPYRQDQLYAPADFTNTLNQ